MAIQEILAKFVPNSAVSYLVTLGIGILVTKLPAFAGKLFGQALDFALEKGSPEMDEFVLAAVKLAEKAIPAPGAGDDKYRMVAHLVSAGLPQLKINEDELDSSIEKAVEAMQAEADKRINLVAPPAPAADKPEDKPQGV